MEWGAFQSDVALLGCDIQIPPNPRLSKFDGFSTISCPTFWMVGYELYVIDFHLVFMSPAKTGFQIMENFFHAKLADFDSLGLGGIWFLYCTTSL